MKRFWSFGLLLLGIGIIFLGFLYDVMFAGIPYQDPTPALAATYTFHATVASIIRWLGTGIFLLGILVVVMRWVLNNHSKELRD